MPAAAASSERGRVPSPSTTRSVSISPSLVWATKRSPCAEMPVSVVSQRTRTPSDSSARWISAAISGSNVRAITCRERVTISTVAPRRSSVSAISRPM